MAQPAKLESFNGIQNEEFQWKFAACFWHHNRPNLCETMKNRTQTLQNVSGFFKSKLYFLTRSFFYGNNNYPFNIFSNIRMFVVPLRLYNLFSFRSICLQKRNQPSSAKPTSHKYMKPTQINTFEPMITKQFFFVIVYIHSSR